jgi:hypothetical protein
MHLNAKMGAVVGQALEETTNMLTEALTLRHLSTYGVVSIEEATFYRNLSSTVITEAAEDFIPDEVETADLGIYGRIKARCFHTLGNINGVKMIKATNQR